ncbi:MAG: McrC family protein [Sulfurimonas sp.]|uniref:McrC family protein n=1 Tax=Sulfurimonas sp. TaxID=2022749 RepID=UPI0026233F10|nr:restriction endonuclease [Sulfurimonas sp.]MCW8895512.1 McrC family protein [Sulfurimonas sp.]MCW8955139.1 McrC family protein [Sulfurimonas sp.]MCW9068215.1 McrC family protein [Sulfurimonas sp.]
MDNVIYEYCEVKNTALKQYIIDTSSLHKYFKLDWSKLKLKHYCGVLNFEDKDYYLLPKISKKDEESNLDIFIYMLMKAYDIKVENEDIASCKNNSHNILEVFIQIFAHKLFREFQRGIYKEYITEQDNLTTLRGKYLINENLKYNFTKEKIYCEYDEFSEDNKLNQFFLYAVKTLLSYTKNKKLLKQCELILNDVAFKNFDINNLHVDFNRLNNRFKDSYEFAILLLSRSIPLFAKDKKSFAFLFNMNDLFENFIGKIYEDIDNSTKLQNQKDFANLRLKPDIITDECIIDTKYKKVKTKDELSVTDKYQMFVYGTNFDKRNTMLLYPLHVERVNEDLQLGKDDKMVGLKMRSIDLEFSGSYGEFLSEIESRLGSIR